MVPFHYSRVHDDTAAMAAAASGARYLAGGTTLVDLMREHVEQPAALVDINRLAHRPALADLVVDVAGDFLSSKVVLSWRFAARMFL